MNEFKNASESAAAIIEAHQSRIEDAAAFIFDFCDDPAITSSPTLVNAMIRIATESSSPDEFEITAIHELLSRTNRPLADALAACAELCPEHSCDPEICQDEKH